MNTILLGDEKTFGITATFFEDVHTTELSMFAKGKNILAFRQGNEIFTTRWNLDELVLWLKDFISNLSEDPYPVDVAGIYAAEKDDNARNFDSDDEDVFDAYYDKLYEWNERHKEQSLPMQCYLFWTHITSMTIKPPFTLHIHSTLFWSSMLNNC